MKLFDTNIIVYAYDELEVEKRKKCLSLLQPIFEGKGKGYVTNQILGETFIVLTKHMKMPSSIEDAKDIIELFISSNNWVKINYDYKTVKKAVGYVKEFKINFWDAVIAATMIENNISSIYTENEKDFKKIPGINVINPLLTADQDSKTKDSEKTSKKQ